MRVIWPPEDRALLADAARPVSLQHEEPPYGPGTPTGLTNKQQAALYWARRRRRQRLGVVPGPDTGGGVVTADWVLDWTLGGITPSAVLDFRNTRYYNGVSNSATLASMVQNTGTIDSTGLIFTGANNVNCIGALLTAFQQAAVTVGVDITNHPLGACGIVAFGSGNPDAPILGDYNGGGGFNAWNGVTLFTNYLDQPQFRDTVGPVRVASRWNAGNRGIIWNNTSPVATAASGYAAVTSAKLGNYGANLLPFTGKMRFLAVYPSFLSDTLMKGLSWRGPWALPVGGRGIKLTVDGANCTPGVKFSYEYTQAWTATASLYLSTAVLNTGSANTIFGNTDLGAGTFKGYWAYVNPSGKVVVQIMSGWTGGVSTSNIIIVTGSSNVCDAHNVVTISYDGSGVAAGVKIYVNGVLETLTTNANALSGTIVNATNFSVGALVNGGTTSTRFGDLMMSFILDNVVRDQTYITANHSRAAQRGRQPVADANTQLYYDFRELAGTTTADRSSNGFNGTLSGSFQWVTSLW